MAHSRDLGQSRGVQRMVIAAWTHMRGKTLSSSLALGAVSLSPLREIRNNGSNRIIRAERRTSTWHDTHRHPSWRLAPRAEQ